MDAMEPSPAIAESRTITPAQLRLLADPVREFIVQSTVPCARTVAELATGLGCAPTRLYRHVQRLLGEGLLQVEREVRVRGTTERHFRASAKVLKLDRARFSARGGRRRDGLDAILAYVFDQSRADIEGAVAAGQVDPEFAYPDPRSVVAWRNVARVTPDELARLQKKAHALYREVDRLSRRRSPRGEMVSLAIALFPCNPVSHRARRAPRKEPSP
jgi:hypothetical protein